LHTALLFSVFFLHFTFAYTGIRPKKRLIPALYLFLLLVFALSPTDLLVSGMGRDRYGFLPISGPLFPFAMLVVCVLIIAAFINLIKAFRASSLYRMFHFQGLARFGNK